MASNDEYQQIEFWEPICIEKDKDDNCLVSLTFTMIDFSPEPKSIFNDLYKTEKP